MARTFIFIICIVFCSSCKKEVADPVLSEVQYKIVNNGDPLVNGFVLWTSTVLADGRTVVMQDQAFNGIQLFDTVTMRTTGLQENSRNFLGSTRSFRMRVSLKRKIYSPFHFNDNYLEGGDPYMYGWTQSLNFIQEIPDTIRNSDDKIIYINWPGDSTKLKQVIFF